MFVIILVLMKKKKKKKNMLKKKENVLKKKENVLKKKKNMKESRRMPVIQMFLVCKVFFNWHKFSLTSINLKFIYKILTFICT